MNFNQAVYWLVRRIPPGRVIAYGQVAVALGYPRAARAVGGALHICPEDVPWWRVVNRRGQVTTSVTGGLFQRQIDLLRADGVDVDDDGTLVFPAYEWWPDPEIEALIETKVTGSGVLDQEV